MRITHKWVLFLYQGTSQILLSIFLCSFILAEEVCMCMGHCIVSEISPGQLHLFWYLLSENLHQVLLHHLLFTTVSFMLLLYCTFKICRGGGKKQSYFMLFLLHKISLFVISTFIPAVLAEEVFFKFWVIVFILMLTN